MFKDKKLDSKWLTTSEAVKYLGRTKNALWLMVSRGYLEKRKWHGRLYFKKSELDNLIEQSTC
jgi:hypothetical protein